MLQETKKMEPTSQIKEIFTTSVMYVFGNTALFYILVSTKIPFHWTI